MPGCLQLITSQWPKDYFLFPKFKEHLSGTRFSSESDVKTVAENWLNGHYVISAKSGHVIGFRAKGGSISETANFVNCSRAAVVKVYRAWQYGTIQNQRRGTCGAPRAIDDRGERRLRRYVRANRRATVEQLTAQMNQGATKSISSKKVQRTLLRMGLRSRRLVNAPMLTAVHRRHNARCHTARNVCAWFEEHQDEFTVLPWPANSPDLNPVENLWDHLDRVASTMDPQPRNLAQLATALESAWLNIPVNTFRNLIDSLPARLAAVRFAKFWLLTGGH
ncbi:hypothetical protein AVEN_80942-1 [Araneus ventricosus]|uniref:Tc1-like transposase DDE domain-containing protein n=1 Tax=Araneus ventricosus TaxID=182803 RepID=A0A4Y2SUW8_ARAVE|nr:hypothetical protein AVEN_80942-1 [Araneus ventricosus]